MLNAEYAIVNAIWHAASLPEADSQAFQKKVLTAVCEFSGAAAGHLVNLKKSNLKDFEFHESHYCRFRKHKYKKMLNDHAAVVKKFPVTLDYFDSLKTPVFRHAELFGEDWRRSEYYRGFLQANGLDESVGMVCRDAAGEFVAGIGMSWKKGQRVTSDCLDALARLAPCIGLALVNSEEIRKRFRLLEAVLAGSSDAIFAFDREPKPSLLFSSGGAAKILDQLSGSRTRSGKFLQACGDAVRAHTLDTLWHAPDGRWYRITVQHVFLDGLCVARVAPLQNASQSSGFSQAIKSDKNISLRESEVFEEVAQGLSDKEIARKLGLSIYTVRAHIRRIYRKLNVSSRVAAVNAIRKRGPHSSGAMLAVTLSDQQGAPVHKLG